MCLQRPLFTLASAILLAIVQLGPSRCGTEVGNPLALPHDSGGGRVTEGIVYKGPVEGAAGQAFTLGTSAFDKFVGAFNSTTTGSFFLFNLPKEAVLIEARGGSYIDESRFPNSYTLDYLAAYFTTPPLEKNGDYAVLNPLTTMAARRINERIESISGADGQISPDQATAIIEQENTALADLYGLPSLMIFVDDPFSLNNDWTDSEIISLLMPAGLAVLSEELGFDSTDQLLALVAADYSDGTLDGQDADGNVIEDLSGLDINHELDKAITAYLHPDNEATLGLDGWTGGTNFTGLTRSDWENIKVSIPAFQ